MILTFASVDEILQCKTFKQFLWYCLESLDEITKVWPLK